MMKKYIVKKNEKKQIIIDKGGEYVVELVGEGANVEILGTFHLRASEKLKVSVEIVHKAKRTKADTIIRAVVEGKGKIEIRGKIIVEKGAGQTESFLQERVLLASNEAKATAIPDLEIKEDEVKCSHAVAIGSLDKKQVYYLMSRGMSKKKASKMIINGFLQPVWDKIRESRIKA